MIMTKNDYEYVGIVLDIMYFEKEKSCGMTQGLPTPCPDRMTKNMMLYGS